MLGKIIYVNDNTAHVKINMEEIGAMDLLNIHVIFEDEKKKILGEVQDISEDMMIVHFLGEIIDGKFFTSKTYGVEELNKSYKQLANAINSINKEFHGKTISYWANFGTGNGLDEQLKKELRTDNI